MKPGMMYSSRVKAWCQVSGIREGELARMIGRSPGAFSRKMNNPRLFTLEDMEAIQRVFRWKTIGGEYESD